MECNRAWYLASAIFYLIVTAIAGLLLAINLWTPYIKLDHLQYLNLHVTHCFYRLGFNGDYGSFIQAYPDVYTLWLCAYKWKAGIMDDQHWSARHFYNNALQRHYFSYYIFIALIVLGIIFFLLQINIIFKNRIRKKFDIGIRFSSVAYLMFGLTTLLGTFIAFVDYENIINITLVYGYMIIFGFISMLIVGQMYKIVPFLVWYHKYSSKVGIEKVPMLKDMFNEKSAQVGFYLMITAIFGSLYSLSFRSETGLLISFSLMFISSIIFLFNMITIFRK
ncbi:MAG: hypothetical protein IPJ03_22150 [Ignavibacteriales bacterium]|nr:hypothetical protein [Ignavibacteriales bacterium]